MAQTPKTLVILKGKDSFDFIFEGEGKHWIVMDDPEHTGWFKIEEYENGWYVDEYYDKYENAGVKDLWGLYESLINEPKRTLERLLGEKFEIKEVRIEKMEVGEMGSRDE